MKEKVILFILFISISYQMSLPENIIIGNKQELNFQINESGIDTCNIYKLNTQYNKIGFHLLDFSNIDSILISNKFPIECGKCDESAEVCQKSTISNPTQFVNFYWKLCLNELFIVVSPIVVKSTEDDTKNKASLTIDSTFYKNSPCVLRQETHLSICAESKIEDCRSCKRNGCSVVECGNTSNGNFVHFFDICLANDLKNDEKEKVCQEFDGIKTFNKKKALCEFEDLEGYSTASVILIFILSAFVIVFSLVVVYYNVYLLKHSEPPFEPPTFFPIFLFPRESESNKEDNKREAQNLSNLNKIFKSNDFDNN